MKRISNIVLLILLNYGCERSIFKDKNDDPVYNFNAFWHELDRNYSFFTYSNLNWDSVYTVYRTRINEQTTAADLLNIYTQVSDILNDAHTNIYSPYGITGNIHYFDQFHHNEAIINDSMFESITSSREFEYGRLKLYNIGYVKIASFEGNNSDFEEIDSVLNALKATRGLIIDIRSNRGGLISNSEIVAGRFADSIRVTSKYRVRNGPGHDNFSNWIDVTVSPSQTGYHYHKPVVILTNRFTYSAAEWFVVLTHMIPNITTAGDTTGGGSARTLIRELPNGWILRTSNSQTLLPSGHDFQSTGLYPDYPIWISIQDSAKNEDSMLQKSISVLQNNSSF